MGVYLLEETYNRAGVAPTVGRLRDYSGWIDHQDRVTKTLSKSETSNAFWAIPAEQQLKQLIRHGKA
jgi:hypothetical protein